MVEKNDYRLLVRQITELIQGENDEAAVLSNVAAALHDAFSERFFWVGFYRVKDGELLLGPFQGPVACTRIRKGKGVCGTSWENREAIVVPDVDLFPGHIACSSLSRSEIVVPIIKKNNVVAVLDVDSEYVAHFDETDKKYLIRICDLLAKFV